MGRFGRCLPYWRWRCRALPRRLRRRAPTAPTTPAAFSTSSRRARARASTPPRSPTSSRRARGPAHNSDQLQMYEDLVYATPGLTEAQLTDYFKDATFGVKPEDVERVYSPRDDVTIVRDRFGVPHIYGATRAATEFGAGYVAAEDRMFFIDALRHAGRAQLASFAGGSRGQRRDGPERLRRHPVPKRPGASGPVRPRRRGLRRGGRAGRRGRHELRRRDQRQDRRDPHQPAADAGRVRAARPPRRARRLEGHRRDLDRLAGRRDLRQGRRQRGRVGARARGGAKALRRAGRAGGLEGLPPRQRPRGPHDGPRHPLPVHAAPAGSQGGGARSGHPRAERTSFRIHGRRG